MKKIHLLLIVLISNLFGQTFTGIVKDVSGTEISYVVIEELSSKSEERNWTTSDENGGFSIIVMNESSILFQRIGYKDVIVKPEDRLNKSIIMVKENISLDEVDVYGSKKEEYLKKAQDELSLAEANAIALDKMSISISANAQESGSLFGSVGITEILDAIHAEGHDFVKRASIIMPTGPIKEVGEFEVNVELHPEIVKSISIEVKAT